MYNQNHVESLINQRIQQSLQMSNEGFHSTLRREIPGGLSRKDKNVCASVFAGAKIGMITGGPLGCLTGCVAGFFGGLLFNELDKK